MPVHHFVNDSTLVDKGLANYWGYNTIGFLAPDSQVRLEHLARRPGAGVQGDGARAARGGHRGHPRRRLQPHRRGQPPRPDAVVPRHRQRRLLPARRRRPAALHGLHRHRQHAQRPPPAHPAADHGLAAVLGHRDARRRVPLRPRRDTGPRVLRRRPAVQLLRTRAAGPGRQPGQADRRAVGRRARRLPGRQLPAAVDGVERQVPRHGARLLARRAGHDRRVRGAASPARPTCTRPPGAARSRASTSSPRTTGSRCATWSATTRSTTRPTATTTTTARATTGRGTAASRDRPTTPTILALRAQQRRNFLATLFLSQGVPMLAHGDEIGRTQQGNNNGYCQDNELTWIDWEHVDVDLLAFTRRVDRAAPRASDLPPPALLRRPPGPPARRGHAARHRVVHARRQPR